MARIKGVIASDVAMISITPQSTGAIQLAKVCGQVLVQSDGTYDFQLPVGIYDISLYDSKSLKRLQRCGVYVSPTDATITLEGLLVRQ